MPLASAGSAVAVNDVSTGVTPAGTETAALPLSGPVVEPSVNMARAIPSALVETEAGDAEPAAAFAKENNTVAFATGLPWLSVTKTSSESSKAVPTLPVCPLPFITSMCAASPSPGRVNPSPPHAAIARGTATRNAARSWVRITMHPEKRDSANASSWTPGPMVVESGRSLFSWAPVRKDVGHSLLVNGSTATHYRRTQGEDARLFFGLHP